MYRRPLDYQSRHAPPAPPDPDWRRRRFGVVSLAIACSVVACFGITVLLPIRSEKLFRGILFCFDAALFIGGTAGVVGADFDRERRLAYFGMFLNFALLLPALLLTLASFLVMSGFN